jgi:hypothetical protein
MAQEGRVRKMAYNYYPNTYQAYPQYPTQPNAYPTQMNVGASQPNANQNNNLIWVQGEAGAKSYLVAPNQTVQLWDSEAPVIYLKSADQMGIPSMRIIDYTFRDNAPKSKEIFDVEAFATKDDVDSLKAEIEALRAKFEVKEGAKK